METIVPSPSATIGQVARFIQLLERHGVAGPEIQRFIDDVELRNQVVSLMRPLEQIIDISGDFNNNGLNRLVDHYWQGLRYFEGFVAQGYCRLEGTYTRDTLATSEVARDLLEGLGSLQTAVFVLRLGLVSGKATSVEDTAKQLGIATRDVNTLRRQANRHIESRAEKYPLPKLVFRSDAPILALLRVPRGYTLKELQKMNLEELRLSSQQVKSGTHNDRERLRRFHKVRELEVKWPFGDFTIANVTSHSERELIEHGWSPLQVYYLESLLSSRGLHLTAE